MLITFGAFLCLPFGVRECSRQTAKSTRRKSNRIQAGHQHLRLTLYAYLLEHGAYDFLPASISLSK